MELVRVSDGLYRGEQDGFQVEVGRGNPGAWVATISRDGVLHTVCPPCKTYHVAGALAASTIRKLPD